MICSASYIPFSLNFVPLFVSSSWPRCLVCHSLTHCLSYLSRARNKDWGLPFLPQWQSPGNCVDVSWFVPQCFKLFTRMTESDFIRWKTIANLLCSLSSRCPLYYMWTQIDDENVFWTLENRADLGDLCFFLFLTNNWGCKIEDERYLSVCIWENPLPCAFEIFSYL